MKQSKKSISKHMVFSSVILIMFLTIALTLSIVGVMNNAKGWFSNNKNVTGSGMGVSVKSSAFEVAYTGELDYEDDVITFLNNDGYNDSVNISSPSDTKIYCFITDEYDSNLDEIEPGSYGYVEFDLVLESDYDTVFNIDINSLGIKKHNDVLSFEENSEVLDLLNGHILFFETRTPISGGTKPYYYSDRILDSFTYDTSIHSSDKRIVNGKVHYKVNIYWIWAISFSQIIFETDSPRLYTEALFDSDTERDELIDYIKENPNEFFDIDNDSEYYNNDNYYLEYFVELSNGYNNADQVIGDNIHYFVLEAIVNIM